MKKKGKIVLAIVALAFCSSLLSACTFLNDALNNQQTPVHEHEFKKVKIIEPTCESEGYTLYKCECEEEKTDDATPALGHNFMSCSLDQEGKTTGTCARLACKKTQTFETPYTDIFKVEGAKILSFTEETKNRYVFVYLPAEINGVKITQVGASAFDKSETLVEITVPNGYTHIEQKAMANCENLTVCNLGKDISSLGAWSFYNSKKLTRLAFNGTNEEWGKVKKGSNWNSVAAFENAFCLKGDKPVLSEIKVNGQQLQGTNMADFDFVYDLQTDTYTQTANLNNRKAFYPLKATGDYVLRLRMGANSGETDFIIYASQNNYINFRTGVDKHTNEVFFMKANGSWNSETRVGYDLSKFVNLDGNGGMLDLTIVRYNQGFYVYTCDYIEESTGQAAKQNAWQLIFSAWMNDDASFSAEFKTTTHDAWGHEILDNKNVRPELKSGVQSITSSFENAFMFQNITSANAKWQIELDDLDASAEVFVKNPPKVK